VDERQDVGERVDVLPRARPSRRVPVERVRVQQDAVVVHAGECRRQVSGDEGRAHPAARTVHGHDGGAPGGRRWGRKDRGDGARKRVAIGRPHEEPR